MIHWWVALGPELQAATVGAVATVLSTIVGVLVVRAQIRSSVQQSRDATTREHRETIKTELYRDVASCVAKAQEAEGDLFLAGQRVLDRLQAKPWAQPLHGPAAEIGQFFELTQKSYALCGTLAGLMIAIEKWEIADPALSLFQAAFASVGHDIRSKAQQLTSISLSVGDVRMAAARELQPEGELHELPSFDHQQVEALEFGMRQLLCATSDAGGYLHDTRIGLQNLLLADIFQNKLPPRQPLDPTIEPLSLKRAAEQEDYFLNRSPWAVEKAAVNERTKAEIARRADPTDK